MRSLWVVSCLIFVCCTCNRQELRSSRHILRDKGDVVFETYDIVSYYRPHGKQARQLTSASGLTSGIIFDEQKHRTFPVLQCNQTYSRGIRRVNHPRWQNASQIPKIVHQTVKNKNNVSCSQLEAMRTWPEKVSERSRRC